MQSSQGKFSQVWTDWCGRGFIPFRLPISRISWSREKVFLPCTWTLPKVAEVASICGRTRLIKKRENVYCSDWFNFLLLLRTLTVWYSHNRKRQRHNQIWKKMEKFWFVWLGFCRVYYLLACLAHSLGPPYWILCQGLEWQVRLQRRLDSADDTWIICFHQF